MSTLNFSFVPLTFINSESEILRQIRNTTVFSYLFEKYEFTKNLSELIENTQYGYNAAATDIGTHKFLRISDIKEGSVNWEDVPFCDCKDEKTYKLFDDDILIARTGGTTGKSFVITNPPDNAVFAGYLIRIRAKSDIDPIFIYEFLNSYVYWSQISDLKMGSAQPNVNAEKLKTLIIPYGPDEVIKEITQFFKTGNSQIEELNERVTQGQAVQKSNFQLNDLFSEQLSLVTSLRQAILTEAVQGQLTAQWRKENPNQEHARELLKRIAAGKARLIIEKKISKEKPMPLIEEELPYKLPEGWKWEQIGNIAFVKGGKRIPKGYNLYDKPTPYVYIRVTDMKNGTVLLNNLKYISSEVHKQIKNYVISKNDLYITIAGTIGEIGEIPNELDNMNLTENAAKIVFEGFPKQYFKIALNSTIVQSQFTKKTKQVAQPKLALKRIQNTYIPIPPLSEQDAIVQIVNSLMAYCDELEQQVQQSKADLDLLMQSVLSEVFGMENQIISSKPTKTKPSEKETLIPAEAIQTTYEGNTLNMELLEILQQQGGKIAAINLWKLSKYQKDIDDFYHALKQEVEVNKTIKESSEKGWLELVEP